MPKDALLIMPGMSGGEKEEKKSGSYERKFERAAKAAFEAVKMSDEGAFVDALKGAIEYCLMAREDEDEGEGY